MRVFRRLRRSWGGLAPGQLRSEPLRLGMIIVMNLRESWKPRKVDRMQPMGALLDCEMALVISHSIVASIDSRGCLVLRGI